MEFLKSQIRERVGFVTKGQDERTAFALEYKVREYIKLILIEILKQMGTKEYRCESER